MNSYLIIVFQFCVFGASTWDLRYFGITENYYVSSLAIYRNRAFVALPRSSCHNNVSNPTLIEVPWVGDHEGFLVKKKNTFLPIKHQKWDNCKQLQDVVSVEAERRKGRLWVLDRGNSKCPPKIQVYSLFFNSLLQNVILKGVPKKNLNTLVVDTDSSEFGPRAYIGDAGDNQIIVFSLNDAKWWKMKMVDKNNTHDKIHSSYLAISKIKPVMYVTGGNATEVFIVNLDEIRNSNGPLPVVAQEEVMEITVNFAGNKLGPSSALLADYKEGLNYYLVRDFAILRWNTRMPLQAEYHDVLAQSYKYLHYVPQLFMGPQNDVWALVNPSKPLECDTSNKRNHAHQLPEVHLKSRVVKIMKYVRTDLA